MSDPRYKSNSQTVEPGAERPRRRWLRLAIAGFLALLVVGVALAGSTGSDTKATLRNAQSFNKIRGGPLAPPDFQFIGQGQIMGGVGETWLISGVPIELDDHTQIVGDLQAGDFVILSGRILKNGAWLADQIEESVENATFFTFNGPLVSMQNGIWVVGDKSLVVNERTELQSDLALNDPVLVTFTVVENNSWLALKVEYFDAPWIEPTPTSTETLAPAAKPAPAHITTPKDNPPKPKSTGKSKGNHGRGKNHGRGGGGGPGGGEGDD